MIARKESIVRSGASVLGSVPSALEALDAGASALQGVRWVFTWGEAMAPTVAQRWRSERRRVVELLIIALEDLGKILGRS